MKNSLTVSHDTLPKPSRSGMWWSPLAFLFAMGLVIWVQPKNASAARPTSPATDLTTRIESLEKRSADLEVQLADLRHARELAAARK